MLHLPASIMTRLDPSREMIVVAVMFLMTAPAYKGGDNDSYVLGHLIQVRHNRLAGLQPRNQE